MSFKFKPKVTTDRKATQEELECIEETEKMTDKAATKKRIAALNQELRDAYIWSKLAVDVKEGIGTP